MEATAVRVNLLNAERTAAYEVGLRKQLAEKNPGRSLVADRSENGNRTRTTEPTEGVTKRHPPRGGPNHEREHSD
jgi:hypothetical protein